MTVTSRLTLIDDCEADTFFLGEGTWGTDDEIPRVGSFCVGYDCDLNEQNVIAYYDLNGKYGANRDVGQWVFYVWFLYMGAPGNLNTLALGGLRIGIYDGVSTGWYNVLGSDTYPGGWVRVAVDFSQAFTSGSCNRADVSRIYLGAYTLSKSKLTRNIMFDHLQYFDKAGANAACIEVTGGGIGTELDFGDLITDDGIVEERGGAFYICGSIQFGDEGGVNDIYFQSLGQVAFFQDYIVAADYYDLIVKGAAASITSFKVGDRPDSSGISGPFIKSLSPSSPFKLTATDADIDVLGLYGATFDTPGVMDLLPYTVDREVLNCTFINQQGQFQPNTTTVENCNFISALSTLDGAVLIESNTHNVKNCGFIDNEKATEIEVVDTYTYDNLQFTGNTWDINNTSGGDVIVNCVNGSNPISHAEPGGGSTTINNTVYLTIYVKDEAGSPIELAQVAIYDSTQTQLMNEDTDVNGKAEETYNYAGDEPITIRIRKSSPGFTRYVPINTSGTILPAGFTLTAVMIEDPLA